MSTLGRMKPVASMPAEEVAFLQEGRTAMIVPGTRSGIKLYSESDIRAAEAEMFKRLNADVLAEIIRQTCRENDEVEPPEMDETCRARMTRVVELLIEEMRK